MYSTFFGFSEKPFDVVPDPKFLYLNQGRKEPFAAMLYGIKHRRGFVVMIGEVGTGKTTMINAVLSQLDEKTKVANIFNTDVTFEQLLRMILSELDLARPLERMTKVEALERLNKFAVGQLAKGGNVVLFIDEAQNLDLRSMENLRLLSNLETQKRKLIQIVLSGQPELDAKLRLPELRQLAQRISLKRYILALTEKETYAYIRHRLKISNYKGRSLFDGKAQRAIWKYSGGIPRKINILCDNALLIGFALQTRKIREQIVEEAVRDLTWSPFSQDDAFTQTQQGSRIPDRKKSFFFRPGFAIPAGLATAACLLYIVAQYFFPSWLGKIDIGIAPFANRQDASASIASKPAGGLPVVDLETSNAFEKKSSFQGEPFVRPEDDNDEKDAGRSDGQESAEPKREEGSGGGAGDSKASETGSKSAEPEREKGSGGAAGDSKASSKNGKDRIVYVKRGDCLSGILAENYGSYDKVKLDAFMRENPQVQNPDVLRAGQHVVLPVLND